MNCVGFERGVNFFQLKLLPIIIKIKKGNTKLTTNIKIRDYRLQFDRNGAKL